MPARLENVGFTSGGLQFHDYPFAPASIFPNAMLPWHHIQTILPDRAPPEVWTRQGDILFIYAPQRDALVAAANRHGVSLANWVDVWDLILEPFLDTEFNAAHHEETLATLEAYRISREECKDLRTRCTQVMMAYNFATGLWDWAHLGLYDLLRAHWLFRERFGLTDVQLRLLYWEAIAIARRAQRT